MSERFASAAGIDICYETIGDPDARPLLLVMGLSGPMIWWDDAFCRALAERDFFVIRYDNRDTGRSSHLHDRARLVRAALRSGKGTPYTLADMADDAVRLLDHLGLPAAHVAGISMGGMIAQSLAIRYPSRVRSLISMSSTTGNRLVGRASLRALQLLSARPTDGRDGYVQHSLRLWRLIESPAYPLGDEHIRQQARATYDRGVTGSGTQRQLAAILSASDRTPALRRLRIPALVIHGTADLLVHVSGGRATARAIPDAELLVIPGLAHDLPPQLWPVFADGIERTADRAE